ncbi:MAG: hypothetical protein ACI89D_001095 [Bermanella sp.]|jgi:hypothetical protein
MTETYPCAEDLIGAVSDFLKSDVAPMLVDSALQFKLKIAVNVLAIVRRELERGQHQLEKEKDALAAMLREDGDVLHLRQRLIEAINAGEFDAKEDELLSVLEAQSLRQIAIDNPRYSTYQALAKSTSLL